MESLQNYIISEAVKAENGEPWEVYVSNKLDDTFTEWAKKWKRNILPLPS